MAAGALLAAVGCTLPGSEPAFKFIDKNMSHPVGVGGTTTIAVGVLGRDQPFSATSSDASVLSVGMAYDGLVVVSGNKEGSVVFTILDSKKTELAHTTIRVASTTSLSLSSPSGLTVLAGQVVSTNANALDVTGVSIEAPALNVTYAGSVAASETSLCEDASCVPFQTTSPGDGTLTVSSGSLAASMTVHVVPASAIGSFTFQEPSVTVSPNGSGTADYVLSAGGTDVCIASTELTCASSDETVAVAGAPPWTGAGLTETSGTGAVVVASRSAGTATITCTVSGLQASFEVTAR